MELQPASIPPEPTKYPFFPTLRVAHPVPVGFEGIGFLPDVFRHTRLCAGLTTVSTACGSNRPLSRRSLKNDVQKPIYLFLDVAPDFVRRFFLQGLILLADRPQTADLSGDFDYLSGQGFELAEFGNFPFRLADCGPRRQTLGECLAIDLPRALKVRAMSRIARFCAAAAGITATTESAGDGSQAGNRRVRRSAGAEPSVGWIVQQAGRPYEGTPCLKYYIL
jgi:hypothetical protein